MSDGPMKWVKCPGCGRLWIITSSRVWTQCSRCEQQIRLIIEQSGCSLPTEVRR